MGQGRGLYMGDDGLQVLQADSPRREEGRLCVPDTSKTSNQSIRLLDTRDSSLKRTHGNTEEMRNLKRKLLDVPLLSLGALVSCCAVMSSFIST